VENLEQRRILQVDLKFAVSKVGITSQAPLVDLQVSQVEIHHLNGISGVLLQKRGVLMKMGNL
jgi:hypothetical protein